MEVSRLLKLANWLLGQEIPGHSSATVCNGKIEFVGAKFTDLIGLDFSGWKTDIIPGDCFKFAVKKRLFKDEGCVWTHGNGCAFEAGRVKFGSIEDSTQFPCHRRLEASLAFLGITYTEYQYIFCLKEDEYETPIINDVILRLFLHTGKKPPISKFCPAFREQLENSFKYHHYRNTILSK